MRRPGRASWSALAAFALGVAPAVFALPVALPRTERFTVRSRVSGFEYEIRVALPRSFTTSQNRYPVLVLLDADYSFPAADAIVNHLTDRGRLPEMVVVGIGYADADDREAYRQKRTRDYTPWFAKDGGYGPEYQKLSGGGPAFARFVSEELLPAVAARYRTTDDRTLVGHSYGGLFAAWTLSRAAADFRRFIIVSPSLWYLDRRLLGEIETRGAVPGRRVYLAVGQNENPEMESDLRRLHELLGAGPEVEIEVWPRQNHDTVFPFALSNGLRFVWTKEGWGSEARSMPPPALGR
jgi:predicted alpha/beta superfamily hydrolase